MQRHCRILNVLVGCEYSGVVADAFRELGHNAWSCDFLPCEGKHPQFHYQMDVLEVIKLQNWDLAIFHPSCQFLAVSGARWMYNKDGSINSERKKNRDEALEFVQKLLNAPIPHIALENPISVISSKIRKPDQVLQPWQYGHPEIKATCLWLKNLPLLKPTDIVEGREARIHKMPPSKDRGKLRSRTYEGIGKAMADQWSNYLQTC
jgi:hypothetical protein